jgi:pimeloyl-ACP methyl ester carboxylesterase
VGQAQAVATETTSVTRSPHWLRVIPGGLLLVVSLAVLVTSWDTVGANQPALAVLLQLSLLLGLVLLVSGLLARAPAKSGPLHLTFRVLGVAAAIALAVMVWWLKPLAATSTALDSLQSTAAVTVTDTRTATTYEPTAGAKAGLVLYPGARVDPRAYAVLGRRVAEQGYTVVVPKCPLNIEFLCIDAAADYVTDDIPWVVGGHSLGGVAASEYAKNHDPAGLLFWASYPESDLSGQGFPVTSISGSEDGLATPAKISASAVRLPPGTTFREITGAVHSFFGDYGTQPGDGIPTIDRGSGQDQIVAATVALLDRVATAAAPAASNGASP